MDNTIPIITIVLSLVAIVVAFWQGFIAKQQLDDSKKTKDETQKILNDINAKVEEVQNISDETRRSVQDQVTKLIDQQNENFKSLLNAPQSAKQNEMIMQLMPFLLQKPELLENIMKLSEQNKKNE